MDESDLIHLYRDLTAAEEPLARSVAIFVESGFPSELSDADAIESPRVPDKTGLDEASSAEGEARPPAQVGRIR